MARIVDPEIRDFSRPAIKWNKDVLYLSLHFALFGLRGHFRVMILLALSFLACRAVGFCPNSLFRLLGSLGLCLSTILLCLFDIFCSIIFLIFLDGFASLRNRVPGAFRLRTDLDDWDAAGWVVSRMKKFRKTSKLTWHLSQPPCCFWTCQHHSPALGHDDHLDRDLVHRHAYHRGSHCCDLLPVVFSSPDHHHHHHLAFACYLDLDFRVHDERLAAYRTVYWV